MYAGSDYQADFGAMRALHAIDQIRRSPTRDYDIGLELRGSATGTAWDYLEAETTRAEMKVNPTRFDDVREFLIRASSLAKKTPNLQYHLVVGTHTGVLAPLEHLIEDAMTTASSSDFRERVNERDDLRRYSEMLDILKDDAHALLQRMKVVQYPITAIRDAQRLVADNLVGPDRATDLIQAIKSRLIDRAKQQRPWKVHELLGELQGSAFNFLKPPISTLRDTPGSLHGPLVVMQICNPYELPTAIFAAAAAVDVLTIETALVGLPITALRDGHWQLIGEWSFDDSAYTAEITLALQALVATVKANPAASRVTSYINAAVALAAVLKTRAPEVVMNFFVELDRDLKRLGNKHFVNRVARLSLDAAAIRYEAIKETRSESLLQPIREARARTLVCGMCWQLQRSGRLDRAEDEANHALELGPSPLTEAYRLKCVGRLNRLQAEEKHRAPEERFRFLAKSEKHLSEAIEAFSRLNDFSQQRLELGDCHSLLGRTLLVGRDFAGAKKRVALASDLLEGHELTKASLDLSLLRIDIYRAESSYAAAISEGEQLLNFPFSSDAEQNEIKARLHEALAEALIAAGRRTEGFLHFDKAIKIYTSLDEMNMVYRVTLRKRRREGIPQGLVDLIPLFPDYVILHALENALAPAATSMRRNDPQNWSTDQWKRYIDSMQTAHLARPAGELDW